MACVSIRSALAILVAREIKEIRFFFILFSYTFMWNHFFFFIIIILYIKSTKC
jgi:hypothetical protein